MPFDVRPLSRPALGRARQILAAARSYPGAAQVAEEKLFGPGPDAPAFPFGAWTGGGRLVGVAAISGGFVRLVAVAPDARGRGAGTALLGACERAMREGGKQRARIAAQPGNYLAPGVAAEDTGALAWLERRGYARRGENENLVVDVASNRRVSWERFRALARPLAGDGYALRRVDTDGADLTAAVADALSPAWAFEVRSALGHTPSAVHIARAPDGSLAAFAAHDGNNRGLGWFGPAATIPAHRGRGIGRALLVACLADIADAGHRTATIAWIGPRRFYEDSVGTVGAKRYIVLDKELHLT